MSKSTSMENFCRISQTPWQPFISYYRNKRNGSGVHHKKRLLIRLKLSSPQPCLLAHFDPAKELILSCDASSFGTGAVLSHQLRMGWRNLLPLPLIPWRLQRGNTHTSRMKVWQSFMGSKGSTSTCGVGHSQCTQTTNLFNSYFLNLIQSL